MPTIIHCESPDHALANREFLFPFAAVVECPQSEMVRRIGPSLVVTAMTNDENFRRAVARLSACGSIELRPDPDEPDQLGPAARRQSFRSSIRAAGVSSGLMRILSLTAGAAGMYCGTCLRDNSLARELIRQGHDVLLVPIYTPTLTDEENVSSEKVFFGGISVYLQQHYPIFRKLPAFVDKLWDSNWALKLATSGSIPVDPKLLGEMTVSMFPGRAGFQAREIRKLTGWLEQEPLPGRHRSAVHAADRLGEAAQRSAESAYHLHVAGRGSLPGRLERAMAERVPAIDPTRTCSTSIASSQSAPITPDSWPTISDFAQIGSTLSPLGISLEGHHPVERSYEGPLRIGYFARIAPEKGLHILCEAVSLMKEPAELYEPRVICRRQHASYLSDLQNQHGLKYEGSPDRAGKIAFLQSIDVFSMPSPYADPKGLSLLEAMANGVPGRAAQPRSFPEIVGKTTRRRPVRTGRTRRLWPLPSIELAADRDRLRQLSEQRRARRSRPLQHLADGLAHRRDLSDRMQRSRRCSRLRTSASGMRPPPAQ